MDPTSQEAGPSSFTTPKTDQGEWSSSSTPSRHTFPRRLSLLQNDTSSPVRATAEDARTSSVGGPKPLSLGSHPVTSAAGPSGSGATDTPRRGKRTSLSYIPSPSTSVKAVSEVQLSRAPSTASTASGRTRTGSISRATAPRRPPSQSSQTANSDADDWLMSEEDASFSFPSAARAMAQRDSAKVEAQFHDTGYREGITAGKLSTLQNGFDHGFNEVGAFLGREVGHLRGQIAALLLLLTSPAPSSSSSSSSSNTNAIRKVAGTHRARSAPASSLPLLSHPSLEEARRELEILAKELDALTLARLAEPDYEAMEHELEHQDESPQDDGGSKVKQETEEEKKAREAVLNHLKQRNERNSLSRRTSSLGSLTDDPTTGDLLRLIAEKERRCFELREELSSEEAQLKHLRSTWQRLATREQAYSTSPTLHRRDGSTASSVGRADVPQAAAEAWNSLSAKLPGNLRNQLTSLLESIAAPVPEPVPKEKAGDAGGMLRPNMLLHGAGGASSSSNLSVLEEEGSDVGSAALSPRSPRSPAASELHPGRSPNAARPQRHSELASLAVEDSRALGFSVDANGLASISTPSALGGIRVNVEPNEEVAPPTPPKTEPNSSSSNSNSVWTSRRTSVLSSFTNFQARLQNPSTSTEEEGGGGGATFASMLSKRLKEARDNASDLLREAERKLGNAMTIDEFLGIQSPSEAAQPMSPSIQLEEPSADSAVHTSPWFEAAGGQRRRSSDSRQRHSPNLGPTTARGGAERDASRLSVSSSSSSPNLAVPRAASPRANPVVDGASGAGSVYGMLVGSASNLDLTAPAVGEAVDQTSKRASAVSAGGDSWGWNDGSSTDDDDGWADQQGAKNNLEGLGHSRRR